MLTNIIHLESCLIGLKKIDAEAIDIVVTSPPYNLGINYGAYDDSQSLDDYLSMIDDVTSELKRVLKPDGHFWLNMGYSNLNPWIGMDVANRVRKEFVLQNNITWIKSISIDQVTTGHMKPINSERFASPTWEHLFHFTKSGKIRCDKLATGVPFMDERNMDRSSRTAGKFAKKLGFDNIRDFNKNASDDDREKMASALKRREDTVPKKENLKEIGNSWFVPYETITHRSSDRGNHPATFPVALAQKCIMFSGVKSGILLDPFMGTGTSAIAALRQQLAYIGFEIDKDYKEFADKRIASTLRT